MKTRSAFFARKLWAEILLTISPMLGRIRRVLASLGIVSVPEPRELAKVIPIAPYLKQRPAAMRGPGRTPVRIINMPASRARNKG